MSCIRCGQCCQSASIRIVLPKDLADYYHGFGVATFQDGDVFSCRFEVPTPCKHFIRDENGLGGCGIYETRPQICRDYPEPHSKLHKGCGYNKKEIK